MVAEFVSMARLTEFFDVFPDILIWILQEKIEIVVIKDASNGTVVFPLTGRERGIFPTLLRNWKNV